ncbi:hypothetical protein C2E31_19175 [Rhodopirellula baltica]|nr:hypothetical protein C2E31_19175 [Rhodopirellula baltica]
MHRSDRAVFPEFTFSGGRPVTTKVRADSCDRNDRRLPSMLLNGAFENRPAKVTEPLFPIDRN